MLLNSILIVEIEQTHLKPFAISVMCVTAVKSDDKNKCKMQLYFSLFVLSGNRAEMEDFLMAQLTGSPPWIKQLTAN